MEKLDKIMDIQTPKEKTEIDPRSKTTADKSYNLIATGEEVTFYGKDLQQLCEERPEIKEQMYQDTCDQYVMKYQHEDAQEMDPDIQIDETGI